MTLNEFKAKRGLSITDLAKLLGFPVSTVHGWLLGKRKPDIDLLARISEATRDAVTPAELRPDLAVIMRCPAPAVAA